MGVLKVTDFWRPKETYVSTDRYRPLVVHNNKFAGDSNIICWR